MTNEECLQRLIRMYQTATPENKRLFTAAAGSMHLALNFFVNEAQKAAEAGDDARFFAATVCGASFVTEKFGELKDE